MTKYNFNCNSTVNDEIINVKLKHDTCQYIKMLAFKITFQYRNLVLFRVLCHTPIRRPYKMYINDTFLRSFRNI